MTMTQYISEIQKQFISKYKFKPNAEGYPDNVLDGVYPMEIDGQVDHVKITQGRISCCNFKP